MDHTAAPNPPVVAPPVAKQVPHSTLRHGLTHVDQWYWLRDRDDPDTIAYLEAENAWTDQWFTPLQPTIDALFDEIKRRTLEDDTSVPVKRGPWRYYSRTVEGSPYPLHCRVADTTDSVAEQILLDENEAADAADSDYFAVGVFDVSPDHSRLAWASDADGSEQYLLRFRDLASGDDLSDEIADVYYSGGWAADNRTFFYVTCDDAMRPWKVWRHELGATSDADVCVFTEDDERFFVEVGTTRSGDWIIIESASKTTSECWLIDAHDPLTAPRVVEPRCDGHEYSIDHQGVRFLVTTNLDAPDFKVMSTPTTSPGMSNWTELIAHRPGTRISDVDAFDGFFVVSAWEKGNETLTIVTDNETGGGTAQRALAFDEAAYSIHLGANAEYRTDTIRFAFESMTTPASVFDENVVTGERTLLKQQPILDVDLSSYCARRDWARSADGTLVPLDIMYRNDTPLDGTAPVLLYGYGSYEISIAPYFSTFRLSLLDRGVVFALAHPRGGGELGRNWYLDGKLLAKRNTFDDVIACAEHLVEQRVAAPHRIVVRGGSAGGLLVGACISQRPELWCGAIAEVPFVDVVTTMLDETLPLTVTEWEEWGNPAEEPYGSYIASYAPYENVHAVPYPALYVTAGLNDPRVSYHEPAKWVAKIRSVTTGDAPVLLHTEMGAGHGGPSGRYDSWRDEARTLAFALHVMHVI
ncbi:MAG: S9 family peptidase [Acidimicrobiia bacterium]